MSLLSENRIGRFVIQREVMEEAESLILAIMSTVIVVRAEYLFETGGIEYTGLCHSFDKVPRGERSPKYRVLVDTGLKRLVGWEKV